jgi:NADH-quinone oxidoreductase subunit G
MCDEGRFGFHYVNSEERFRQPFMRRRASQVPVPYDELLPAMRHDLEQACRADGMIAGVISPFLTVEEAYLFAKYLKGLSPHSLLALGPVPRMGEDDTYPKDRRGQPVQSVKFTIRAEKCPNRRGIEKILQHFQGVILDFDEITRSASEGRFKAVYLAAGYPPRPGGGWVTAGQAAALRRAPLVIVQDLLPSPASAVADYVLPAAAFAEKDGTFVNHAGLAQAVRRVVRPPAEARTDGQVFLDLLGRRGLMHAATLRAEVAAAIPFFAPLASSEELDSNGVFLDKAQ